MIYCFPYCGRDIDACLRVMNWIGFMSEEGGREMRHRDALLVASIAASKRTRHLEIIQSAVEIFGTVRCYVLPEEDERGWPASCNHLFHSALTHAEKHLHDDMLWMEADAVPIAENWADIVENEFKIAKVREKTFMGAYVKHAIDHMTGVGVYGRNWRSVAPKIDTIVVNGAGIVDAWDVHCANQILPHAFITSCIQHVFHSPVVSLAKLKDSTAIFHQDKRSALLPMLDQAFYDSQCAVNERFSYVGIEKVMGEIKFFHADNSNRVIKSQGYQFRFQGYEPLGGIWRGTYSTQDEGEIIALRALVDNPRNGVSEIDQAEYEATSKKKVIQPVTSEAYKQQPAFPPQQIKQSPAVLVEDPSQLHDVGQGAAALPDNLDGILRLGTVKEPNPSEEPKKIKRTKAGRMVKVEKP